MSVENPADRFESLQSEINNLKVRSDAGCAFQVESRIEKLEAEKEQLVSSGEIFQPEQLDS